jgi:UDP-N-acetylmuramoyl-L-alanyl-D-glutamate--2,6-diaminopimelate ligase
MKNFQTVESLVNDDFSGGIKDFLRSESVGQISCDSREITAGTDGCAALFFALAGETTDGHNFIGDVFKKNPRAIVVSERDLTEKYPRSIRVGDMQMVMAVAARKFYGFPDEKLNLVAITGTNGKTTTAYLCRAMLNRISLTGMIGTVEYDLGGGKKAAQNTTPMAITLFRLLDEAVCNGCKSMAMEISSHGLEGRRAHGLAVDAAIFTNLSPEHLDFHKNLENYFASKEKLFNGTNGKFPKNSFINFDDHYGKWLLNALKGSSENVFSFGFSDGADFQIRNVKKNDTNGSIFEIKVRGKSYKFKSPLFGNHNLSNIGASFAACMALHEFPDEFVEAVAGFKGVPGRLNKINLPNGAVAFIDYAHTPDALKVIIEALNLAKKRKLITVFGCGGNRDPIKRAPMTKIVNGLSDFAIATSDNPRRESQENIFNDMKVGVVDSAKIEFISDRREAISRAIDLSRAEDIILIAGKGHETYQLIGGQTLIFIDEEIALQLCSQKKF